MKFVALLMLILASLALLFVPSDAPSDAAPVDIASDVAPYIDVPATVSPPVATPTAPPVAVAFLERESDCPGGVCLDLPASKANRVQAPQRRVVFRGCGLLGRRCR